MLSLLALALALPVVLAVALLWAGVSVGRWLKASRKAAEDDDCYCDCEECDCWRERLSRHGPGRP